LSFLEEAMNCRASICISSDAAEEAAAFEAWLQKWKGTLTLISNDYGCGCCVHLYDVEGPREAIDALPHAIRCHSAAEGLD